MLAARLIAGVTSIDLNLVASVSTTTSTNSSRDKHKDKSLGLEALVSQSYVAGGVSRSPASSVSGDQDRASASRDSAAARLSPALQSYLRTIPNLAYMLAPPGFEDAME